MSKHQAAQSPTKNAHAVAQAHTEPLHHAQPSASQVDAIVGNSTSRVASEDRIDFGDIPMGTSKQRPAYVWNQAEQSARVEARVSADSEIKLVRAPEELRPYRDPVATSDSQAFLLEYRAEKRGRFEAYLDVTLVWPDGAQEHKRIILASAAHMDGGPTMEESEQHALESVQHVRDLALQDAERAKRRTMADSEYGRTSLGSHEGVKTHADDLRNKIYRRLDALFDHRINAVSTMEKNVEGFRRVVPEPEYDAMDILASLALQTVSMALPNGIAHFLEPALVSIIEIGPERPSIVPFNKKDSTNGVSHEVPVAKPGEPLSEGEHHQGSLAAEGFRVGVVEYVIEAAAILAESGMEAAKGSAGEHSRTEHVNGGVSADLAADFFGKQRGVLIDSKLKAGDENDVFRRSLGPMLREDPETAKRALEKVSEVLDNQLATVEQMQSKATANEWVRVVAQTGLGVKGNTTTTDMHTANQRRIRTWKHEGIFETDNAERSNLLEHDGIVDVTFKGDLNNPTAPVRVTNAIVRGVNSSVIKPMEGLSLGELNLPIRASGFLGDWENSVTVVRDEAGTIDFVDNTGLTSGEGRWLSKKAGSNTSNRSEGDGARILMEKEILPVHQPLTTDSEK